MGDLHTFREHEPFDGLCKEDRNELGQFASKVLKRKDGDLAASKYVGVITTSRGTVVEILPKIDLGEGHEANEEETRRSFLRMLRCWRRLPVTLPDSAIRSMKRFPMLDVFIYRFLEDLNILARSGLARTYVPIEENLPYLKGRILFNEQVKLDLVDQSKFHVSHDELSVNRPANRLIHSTLAMLLARVLNNRNRQTIRELLALLADVPLSMNIPADWRKHHVDRSMPHYSPVMEWLRLFLFNQGLATFSGSNTSLSLLFPMEQVFEDFVSSSFLRHQEQYKVIRQGPRRSMASINGDSAFEMKPDLALQHRSKTAFILDAKWKRIDELEPNPKHDIAQSDFYQLYAYAKRYCCNVVAMIYPKSQDFSRPLQYSLFDNKTRIVCLPFNVQDPQHSVKFSIETLGGILSE